MNITHLFRLWPQGRIPYTFHETIRDVPYRYSNIDYVDHLFFHKKVCQFHINIFRERYIREAIQDLERDSCLEFEDITDFMDDYMKDFEKQKWEANYFGYRRPPAKYPDYL